MSLSGNRETRHTHADNARENVSRALSFTRRKAGGLLAVASTLLLLLVGTFFLAQVVPIDPVAAVVGDRADRQTYDQVYKRLGLDRPLLERFERYVSGVIRGDWGDSSLTGRPVLQEIAEALPPTIELATLAMLIGTGLGIPMGVAGAVHRGKWQDHLFRILSLTGYSVPIFWLGMMGLLLFYARLEWFPGPGMISDYYVGAVPAITHSPLLDSALDGNWGAFLDALQHLILPAAILALVNLSYISRMTRSFMLEQIHQEYVAAARLKGLSKQRVIWTHIFPNIRVPLITVVALSYGGLLEGAVLTETVFARAGFGQLLTNSLVNGDLNVVLGCSLVVGIVFILLNALSDLLYGYFDPRTRAA
jgi:peptide/nickel transport system permease protein